MAAATQEIAERGYEDASLTRIAERAGVAKGLIWRYFTGKDDLMEATATATMVSIRERIAGVLDLSLPVPDVIRAALRHVAALTVTHRAELIALNRIVHNVSHPDGVERVKLDYYEETYQAQETLFRHGQAEGSLQDFDTRVMAVAYQGSVEMMLDYLGTHPNVDPHTFADELADVLLAGIRRTRPGSDSSTSDNRSGST